MHLIGPLVAQVDVVRNDAVTAAEIVASRPDAIVLSPGPCTPNEAGVCLDAVREAGGEIPIFGVCLGLQAIGQVFGGEVVRAPQPMHGKVSEVEHRGETVFRGLNGPFRATRYHSLIVDRETCPTELAVTARDAGRSRSWRSRTARLPIHGVQFHPESILSEHGVTIMRNFLEIAAAWNGQARDKAAPARALKPRWNPSSPISLRWPPARR